MRDGRRLPGPAPRPPRPGQRPAEEARQGRGPGGAPSAGAGPSRPVIDPDLRRARHRRQQELAVPATLDRQARRPAGNHPGDRLTGIRPRRSLVTPGDQPVARPPQARTPQPLLRTTTGAAAILAETGDPKRYDTSSSVV